MVEIKKSLPNRDKSGILLKYLISMTEFVMAEGENQYEEKYSSRIYGYNCYLCLWKYFPSKK